MKRPFFPPYQRFSMQKCMPECSGGAYGSYSAFRSTFHFAKMKSRFIQPKRNIATFTENLKLFQWFKMFHSFIEVSLRARLLGQLSTARSIKHTSPRRGCPGQITSFQLSARPRKEHRARRAMESISTEDQPAAPVHRGLLRVFILACL